MKLNETLLTELNTIPWLERCGLEPTSLPFKVKQVSSWREALELCGNEWGDETEEALEMLSEFMSSKHASAYQGVWNKRVRESRPSIEATAGAKAAEVAKKNGLSEKLVDLVKWDVLGAVMESSYASFSPPVFFTKLIEVYKTGHFPCGRDDDGCLLIY